MNIDKQLMDNLHEKALTSPRLRMNLDLRNSPEEKSQRMLNVLEVGTLIPIHRHKDTEETLILLEGDIYEVYYDDKGKETERIHICDDSGILGVQVPINTWHKVEVVSPSVIIEVKAGKYQPMNDEDILEV